MGIELPAELAEIARVTGVSWPEADEDALRTQAQGWRRAAQELTALARDADVCVTRVFEALSGPAAEAAQARWSTLGDADTGLLAEAIKGATEAADRLDHAAEQVGRAKVEIVRQLVEAAQTRDATLVAADTGHPTALLGLETVLRDAAVNLGNVTSELIDAVGADPASTPDLEGRPGPVDAAGIDGVEAAPAGESADETGTEHGAASASAEHADGAAESDEPDEESGTEDTGPISLAQAPTPPTGQRFPQFIASEAPTPSSGTAFASGPVAPPPSGQQQVGPPVPGVPGPVAAEPWVRPGQTHLSGFAGAPVAPSALPNAGQYAPPPQWGGYAPQGAVGASYVPMPPPGHGGAPPGPGMSPAVPPAQPGVPPGAPGRPVSWHSPYPAAPYAPQAQPWPQASGPHPGSQHRFAAPQPAPQQPVPQPHQPRPHPGAAAVPVGAPRQERESVVALFVVHMFPIGHLPVASDRPARQLPVPESDDCGVARFAPHDHPRSDEIDPGHALTVLRGGGRYPAPPPAEVLPCPPAELTDAYDPLGGLTESEWNHRYLVRDGERPEYAWPTPEQYPEGCHEPGEAVVLEEGTILDRFGTAYGRVFAADGTGFPRRGLPPAHLDSGYRRYRVLRELPVWRAVSAPWFGQPGGGVRYRTMYSAAELVALGYLADITFEERA